MERSGLLTVFLTLAIICGAQPVAKFNASPVSGCTPLLVNFQDSSTGNPTTWKWDLGNGTISFLQNPSVTYFNPGQYSVKLVVQNSSGKDSLIKQQYISVYALPVPGFSAPVRTGCYPLNVSFTDESLAGSGSITEWFWDFGDGTSATSQNPSHTYTNA
ncbi:MAG: PKD domain-containing protein, partial [Ferruginibacter sp.]